MTLPERLKMLRNQHGLGQREVAAALHCSVNTISAQENGFCTPRLGALVAAARLYGVSTDYLLGLTEVPDPPYAPRVACGDYPLSRLLKLLDELPETEREFLGHGFRLLERLVDGKRA